MLEEHHRWAAAEIQSYRFTFWEYNGGWSGPQAPVRVTVSEGKLVAARYLHYAFRPGRDLGFDITEREIADIAGRSTISELFDLMQKDLQQAGLALGCTFHPELGFPMKYERSYSQVFDAGYGFSISDFEVLE
ncbi:MAG TPA: DUF6174 domain-containing protein [Nitrospiraceae bacterium]|nr:DUF6174 domain-containing protein [Nitrospiraceae bacterium]